MLLKPLELLSSKAVSPATSLKLASASRLFTSTSLVRNEEVLDLHHFRSSLDELLYYQKTPPKLRKFIYRPIHAEKVLRAELFDKETGRPFRPTTYPGPPKASLLNNYLQSINSFEELVIAKNYIRELDVLNEYLTPLHLINFIIKSGEFEKLSFGLKTVNNLKNFKFNDELVRFIYLMRLLKFESEKVTDMNLLGKKLSVPLHKSQNLNSEDPILNLLSYSNYGTILVNGNFALIDRFNKFSQPLVKVISNLSPSEIPSYKSFSVGKQRKTYSQLKFEHLYLKKSGSVLSELSENDVLPSELKEVLLNKIEPFVSELDELIYGIEGREDFLTTLESTIKFTGSEKDEES